MKVIQMMMNEFEEWMGNYDCCPTPEAYSAAKAAYKAGAAAMKERCARLVEEYDTCMCMDEYDIAASIRGLEI